MKILIVNNMAPFIWGGAEELAVHLKKNLKTFGHECEILRIPFQWEPSTRIPSQMLMVRGFELANVDKVIALKFPAYLIRHPGKTLWLLHQFRQAYDLFDSNPNCSALKPDLRQLIYAADNECFNEISKIYTNSEVTKQRLLYYNGFNSDVLLPPVNDPELFSNSTLGTYIFAGGRINSMKRQSLLVAALKYTKNVRLVIAGPPDSPSDADNLKQLVEKCGVQARVNLDLRSLPRETYANYVKNALVVAYLPYDEDSLGYVAMEAAVAGKPLITTNDSGGILGLAKHEETGWVAEPNSSSLAMAMEDAWKNKTRTQYLGKMNRELWNSMNINWSKTIETLLT